MLGYLFAAAAVVWVGTFAYVVVLLRRQRKLRMEMEDVKRMLDEVKQG